MEDLVKAFVRSAERAKQAGADAVELHGAHGYLILNFLSPLYNRRTDRYGGDTAGRTRFAEEIVQNIKQRLGRDFPVMFRISAQESVAGGLSLDEAVIICQILEKAGVDAFDVTSGSMKSYQEVIPPADFEPAWRAYMAERIKKAVNVPVMSTGRINYPEMAERVLSENQADMIGLGRALICDPEFPKKIAEGRTDEIRICISCNQGCADKLRSFDTNGNSLRTCLFNPLTGHERDFAFGPAAEKKRIVVVGGGAAGMEAAHVSAIRGHEVTLFEKDKVLGGQIILAATPPDKQEINNITKYFEKQFGKLGVKVKTECEATVENIESLEPDVVILATGSTPITPGIPGAERENVVQAWDVLKGQAVGENVLVAGGGMVGCETADFLAEKGKKVNLIEQLPSVAGDIGPIRRILLFEKFAKHPITVRTNTKIKEIREDGVTTDSGEKISADTVVLAMGVAANRKLEMSLQNKPWELYCVGDCDIVGDIMTAIHRAFHVARQL